MVEEAGREDVLSATNRTWAQLSPVFDGCFPLAEGGAGHPPAVCAELACSLTASLVPDLGVLSKIPGEVLSHIFALSPENPVLRFVTMGAWSLG